MAKYTQIQHKSALNLSESVAGECAGYASVFAVEDAYGHTIAPTAFDESIRLFKSDPHTVKMLYQHDSRRPIGAWQDLVATNVGLQVRGKIVTECTDGRDVYELIKGGAIDGLSIGGYIREYNYDAETDKLHILKFELKEISHVTFPANPAARTEDVKSFLKSRPGELPTKRVLEEQLRDAVGLSVSQAKALIAGGFKALAGLRDEDSGRSAAQLTEDLNKLLNILKG